MIIVIILIIILIIMVSEAFLLVPIPFFSSHECVYIIILHNQCQIISHTYLKYL